MLKRRSDKRVSSDFVSGSKHSLYPGAGIMPMGISHIRLNWMPMGISHIRLNWIILLRLYELTVCYESPKGPYSAPNLNNLQNVFKEVNVAWKYAIGKERIYRQIK